MHASDLIYCRRKAWYRKHQPTPEVLDADTLMLFLMGQGHHAVFQRCIPEHEEQFTLTDSDGTIYSLVGTPDMDWPEHIELPAGLVRPPGEIKTTRYSAEKVPDRDIPHYIEQLATYCLARKIDVGRLYVAHINGSYGRSGMKPVLRCYEFAFTEDELRAWGDHLAWRAYQITQGDGKGGPPDHGDTHYKWECGHCPYNKAAGGPCYAPPGLTTGFFVPATLDEWMKPLGEMYQ
jgi:hypothetical protein